MINRKILIDGLEELADKDLQERLWLHGDANFMSSFEEALCYTFDDSGLTRALDSGSLNAIFSDELCDKIRNFDRTLQRMIDQLPQHPTPQQVIDHPKMQQIRSLAKEVLTMLNDMTH